MKNKPFLPALTLVAASLLITACGGGGDDDGPGTTDPTGPSSASQILTVSGADTAGFGTQLDLREFAFGRIDLTLLEGALLATSPGVLATLTGGGGPTLPPEPVVVIVTTPFAVSMRINTSNGSQSWRYSTACFVNQVTAPCPNISFDRANRRVTFNDQLVQAAGGSDNLATAPIRLTGSLAWAEDDE